MEKKLTCIACPIGCSLEVEFNEISGQKSADGIHVSGNKCLRGEAYAKEEITEPKRTVTAVVSTGVPEIPWIPVKSSCPVPKEAIPELLHEIYSMRVSLPVKTGQICISNYRNSGIDMVYTRTAPFSI